MSEIKLGPSYFALFKVWYEFLPWLCAGVSSVTDLLFIITHSSIRLISRPSNSISIYELSGSWSNSRMHAHWSEFSTWTSYLSQSPIRQVQDNHSSQLHWPNLLIIKYSYYLRFYYYLNQFTKEPSHNVEKIVEIFYPILQTKPPNLYAHEHQKIQFQPA